VISVLTEPLFQIPVTERIAHIPTHAQQDDVGLEMTPFERILMLLTHRETSFPFTLTDQLFLCNTTV